MRTRVATGVKQVSDRPLQLAPSEVLKIRSRRRASRRGLTLIEVIVVIAIVAVVASLVTVAAFRGITEAKRRACGSNLRQIGLSLNLYTADNDGYWPSAPWYGVLRDGKVVAPKDIPRFKLSLTPYGLTEGNWFSPSDPYARRNVQGVFINRLLSSYQMSPVVHKYGRTTAAGFHFDPNQVSDPSNRVAFSLDAIARTDQTTGQTTHWYCQEPNINGLFFDGRVRAFSPQEPYVGSD